MQKKYEVKVGVQWDVSVRLDVRRDKRSPGSRTLLILGAVAMVLASFGMAWAYAWSTGDSGVLDRALELAVGYAERVLKASP